MRKKTIRLVSLLTAGIIIAAQTGGISTAAAAENITSEAVELPVMVASASTSSSETTAAISDSNTAGNTSGTSVGNPAETSTGSSSGTSTGTSSGTSTGTSSGTSTGTSGGTSTGTSGGTSTGTSSGTSGGTTTGTSGETSTGTSTGTSSGTSGGTSSETSGGTSTGTSTGTSSGTSSGTSTGTSTETSGGNSTENSDENLIEDSTEISVTDITPDEIIFEDDIVYINPCYADVITADDLVDAPETEAPDPASVAAVLAQEGDENNYYYDDDEIAADIRSNLVQRNTTITVYYATTNSAYSAAMKTIFTLALNHTGIYNEGDYLRWTYGGYKGSIKGYAQSGTYYLAYTYTVTYYTTLDQENELDAAVDDVLADLGISGMDSDYDRIKAIYTYICSTVSYDYTNLNDDTYKMKYTAYAAFFDGTAVCQGYSNLFYYMALKSGINARFISGTGSGNAHGWNIVYLDGSYYDLDSTWDSTNGDFFTRYRYFLKCDADFTGHVRAADYSTESFYAAYPMAETSYQYDNGVNIYGHSLALDGKIGVQFYLTLIDRVKEISGSYVVMRNTISGEATKVYLDDAEIVIITDDAQNAESGTTAETDQNAESGTTAETDQNAESGTTAELGTAAESGTTTETGVCCYKFTCPVSAKEMADPILFTFYDGGTWQSLCTDTYSAADYVKEQIDAGDTLPDLCYAMLDYGTCAQNYFGYQTDTPANAAIDTDGSRTIADVDANLLSGYARQKQGSLPDGIHSCGETLVLNDGVSIKIYYQLDDGADISNYIAYIGGSENDNAGSTGDDSSTGNDNTSSTGDDSSTGNDNAGSTGDDSSTGNDNAGSTGDDSSTGNDNAGSTVDDITAAGTKTASTETESAETESTEIESTEIESTETEGSGGIVVSSPLVWHQSGDTNYYYVTIDNISAVDLNTMYEVSVTDGEKTGSLQYSPMTYVYDILSDPDSYSDSLKALCRSIYYYSSAAESYFE